MVRRRMASPRPSAPVRSFSKPQASSKAYTAARPVPAATPVHASAPPPTGMGMGAAAAQPRAPGLMAQMAATAGGVAIGSAVGHAVGNMMTGGNSRPEEVSNVNSSAPVATPTAPSDSQPLSNPCEFEWKQFVECSQTQSDISFCQSLNEAFKQCRARYA